jgi:prepilin-type N-terminal cleavage/methylation domain-containing protein
MNTKGKTLAQRPAAKPAFDDCSMIAAARRCQRGYSLIETIMVMAFLGVAFVAILNVMSTGVSQSVDTELMTKAVTLAEEKMEKVVGDKTSRGYAYLIGANYPVENNPNSLTGFTRTVSITTYSTYKSIQVTVTHPKIAPLRLFTFVTNY